MYILARFRVFAVLALVFVLAACGAKSDKYREDAKEFCQNNKIDNQFIAHWYNMQPTLVMTDDVNEFIKKHSNDINFIEPNYALRLPNQAKMIRFDNTLSAYKILNEIGALSAWRQGYQGQNILIAVIDSGIDIENPKIRDNIYHNPVDVGPNQVDEDGNGFVDDINGWNFTHNNGYIVDEIGHGTSIAGIISGDNMSGESLGVAPRAQLLPIDIMSGEKGNEFDAKNAVDYAISMKANIINNSWTISCSYYLASTFQQYERENVIFVNSAGNVAIDVNVNKVMLASLALSNFLNVGSTNLFGQLSGFSGYGKTINIWAPGEQVPVLSINDDDGVHTKASGTSVSAGIVSGAAALVWSAHPNESAVQIINRLKKRALRVGGRRFIAIDRALH